MFEPHRTFFYIFLYFIRNLFDELLPYFSSHIARIRKQVKMQSS